MGTQSGIPGSLWSSMAVAGSGDFNGDGLTDLYLMPMDQHGRSTGNSFDHVWLSKGDGTFHTISLGTQSGIPGALWSSMAVAGSGDFNGDGLTDLYLMPVDQYRRSTGNSFDHVWLSKGDGTFHTVSLGTQSGSLWSSMAVAGSGDFNGDGLTDLYLMPVDQHGRSTGNSFDHVWLSKGDGTFHTISLGRQSGIPGALWSSMVVAGSGDFNGDGLTDLYLMPVDQHGRSTGNSFDHVWLSKGDGTFHTISLGTQSGIPGALWSSMAVAGSGDFNGDGLTDLYLMPVDQHGRSTGNSFDHVWLSKGDGTFHTISLGTQSGIPGALWSSMAVAGSGDFDGDGLTDLYLMPMDQHRRSTGNNYDHAWLSREDKPLEDQNENRMYPARLLRSVRNGLGVTIDIDYKTLSEQTGNPLYTKGSNASYPKIDLQIPLYVVAKTRIDNGVGGETALTYRYAGLKLDVRGRGILGFAERTVIDEETGIVVTTEHAQQFPYTGLVLRKVTKQNDGQKLSETNNTFVASGDTTKGPVFPHITLTNERTYDLSTEQVLSEVQTTNTSDEFGNPTQITVVTSSGKGTVLQSVETVNEYKNDTANWQLGRLTKATVVSSDGSNSSRITRTSAFEYDPQTGFLTREIVEPDEALLRVVTDYTYDAFGNKTTVTPSGADFSPRTVQTEYGSRVAGQFPSRVINALGHVETHEYDRKHGGQLSLTGPNGLTTRWRFDGMGRKLRKLRADGTETNITYGWCHESCPHPGALYKITTINSGSPTAVAYFDKVNREILHEREGFDGRSVYVEIVYNARGQVQKQSLPYFTGDTKRWVEYTYDLLGRVVEENSPVTGQTTVHHDGLKTTVINGKGQITTELKNALGQTIETQDAQQHITRYSYDAVGNLIQIQDLVTLSGGPVPNVTTNQYNVRGHKIAMDDPDMGLWHYKYNALGELLKQTDAKGQVVSMIYDGLGRLIKRTEPEGVTTWLYDTSPYGVGKLATVSAPNGFSRTHLYDGLGRPTQIQTTIDGASYVMQTSYDLFGRPDTLTYPSGFAVQNAYASNGFLKAVHDSANPSTLYWEGLEQNANGHFTKERMGNGLLTQRQFHQATGLLEQITTGNGTIQNLRYQFDILSRSKFGVFGDFQSRLQGFWSHLFRFRLQKTTYFISENRPNLTQKLDIDRQICIYVNCLARILSQNLKFGSTDTGKPGWSSGCQLGIG
ncbi:VCBS repeat-containing protein [Chloroflexi bacterium TSY]|nr:VCBS repeat-containing protein [Chloroflexi bacterium TSY]